jgi:excinuclease ABC subunit C
MEPRPEIRDKLNTLPTCPGVYLYRDARRTVIYVGKAVNLRNRVRSYWHASAELEIKTQRLLTEIADLEVWPTSTELEALLLECNLIKRYRPKYNVRLKDDKRYPYIKVVWQDPFPRVLTTRQMQQDGARTLARSPIRARCIRRSTCSARFFRTSPATARSPARTTNAAGR